MSLSVLVDQPADLLFITNLIHDCWFDKSSIRFDPDASVLEIPFSRDVPQRREVLRNFLVVKRVRIPAVECVLRIHCVESYQVQDTAGVERYDFNRLDYDPATRCLSVLTGVTRVATWSRCALWGCWRTQCVRYWQLDSIGEYGSRAQHPLGET